MAHMHSKKDDKGNDPARGQSGRKDGPDKRRQADQPETSPRALITGGASGIGLEFSSLLAARGYDLLLVGRNDEKLRQAADDLSRTFSPGQPGFSVNVFSCDLSTIDGARALFDECRSRAYRIDLLINNAGRGIFGPLIDQDPEELLAMLRLNVESLMFLTRLFAEEMAVGGSGSRPAERGSAGMAPARPGLFRKGPAGQNPAYILNIGSVAGRMPMPRFAAYGASKSFVREFSVAARGELRGMYRMAKREGQARRPVYISVLEPGYVRTSFDDNAGIESEDYKRFSFKNAMTPQRVAEIGLRGLFAGKSVIVPGCMNRALVVLSRLVPGRLIAGIVWGGISKITTTKKRG